MKTALNREDNDERDKVRGKRTGARTTGDDRRRRRREREKV